MTEGTRWLCGRVVRLTPVHITTYYLQQIVTPLCGGKVQETRKITANKQRYTSATVSLKLGQSRLYNPPPSALPHQRRVQPELHSRNVSRWRLFKPHPTTSLLCVIATSNRGRYDHDVSELPMNRIFLIVGTSLQGTNVVEGDFQSKLLP